MLRLLLLVSGLPLLAAAEKWTVEDVLTMERIDGVELSRDARYAVWSQSRMDPEKGEPVSNLYLRDLAGDFEVQLTRGKDSNTSPAFSPDSRRIAYLSSRKPADTPPGGVESPADRGRAQIWMLDVRGGEPWAVTKFENGVRAFGWIDNDTLLVAAPEDPSLYEQRNRERKDTSHVVEDEEHAAPVRLFTFSLKTKTARRLTENKDRIARLAVSPDGARAVTIHDRSMRYIYDQKIRPAAFLHDLQSGASKPLFADGKLMPRQVAWSADSRSFYFAAPYTTHPVYVNAAVDKLYRFDLASGAATEVPLDWNNGLAGGFAVTPGGFLALLANGVRPRAALYTRAGGSYTRAWIEGEHATNLFAAEVSADGRTVLFRHSTASQPAAWYSARLEGSSLQNPRPLTDLNAGLKNKAIAKTETVYWKGAKDEQVEGLLYYPHDYQPGKKHPLVVSIHGGPHGADMDHFDDSWSRPANLLAQRGAFVFRPNYHGSSQYGLAWGESIAGGNYNELEWIDVERGVDMLIARGLVDPARLGIMGWSNGSIITIEITTRTTRYKAASAGAGDVNWTSDWGNAVFGHAFDHYYLGKTPMEDPELYIRKSPLWRMDKVTTPTIIFFGTEDKQVPTEQGWQHFRALQHHARAGVRFILFPGEAHSPRKYVHQRRKLEEELAWFDKHLFATPAEKNEALKPGSPLAAALQRNAQAAEPEMAERGRLHISRFEVTRAQFAQFDPSFPIAPGTEAFPATGVSFEQAQRYCEWLSKRTGRKYRLGAEEELEKYLKPARGENTLDAWAGYAVNADDEKRLASLVEGLGPGALLKPVGSHAGSGDDPLFDAGGNAAEWVVAKDGSGKAAGGSADRPCDPKSTGKPRPDYIGFRVVRE